MKDKRKKGVKFRFSVPIKKEKERGEYNKKNIKYRNLCIKIWIFLHNNSTNQQFILNSRKETHIYPRDSQSEL